MTDIGVCPGCFKSRNEVEHHWTLEAAQACRAYHRAELVLDERAECWRDDPVAQRARDYLAACGTELKKFAGRPPVFPWARAWRQAARKYRRITNERKES